MYDKQYVPPTVTVDAVIFQLVNHQLQVGLIKRSKDPFKGKLALPGGYSPEGETTMQALQRIVLYKAGINLDSDVKYMEQLYTFDDNLRDPRGHAVTVTYMGLGINVTPNNPAEDVDFYSVNDLPSIAYDHGKIIELAHARLQAKLSYTNVVYGLLPAEFTLSTLQKAYEAIFMREFDKRNFRKKYHQLDMIEETGKTFREGAHRPAKLYRFKNSKLQTLVRSFD